VRVGAGAGATPVLRTSRVGYAALVTPAPSQAHTTCGPSWVQLRYFIGPKRVPESIRFCTHSGPESVQELNRNKSQDRPRLRPEREQL
jgi:hypothetical protein